MSSFNLFTGNKLEVLAERLAQSIRIPLSDPLESEIIVVQSQGMQRWLSIRLAELNGVCANVIFPFPRTFLYTIASKLADIPIGDEFEPEFLTWRIMELLSACVDDPVYREIKNYLAQDHNGLKKYQLCARIASTFDRYLVYRPEIIAAWEKGDRGAGDEIWQADLWRRIRHSLSAEHLAGIYKGIAARLASDDAKKRLPSRIAVFGISSLPPIYLHFFQQLSRVTDINGFFLNPSREFWLDIRSDGEIETIVEMVREKSSLKDATREDLHLFRGNSLLASFGRVGRDFYSELLECPALLHEEFSDPGEDTLLHRVQTDILCLTDRGEKGLQKPVVSADDRSIQIHSCHSMLREIEVLYDNLLNMFATIPDLMPKDIVVMAPDIEKYAPYIDAVFGVHSLDRRKEIRYGIADCSMARGSSLMQAMAAILEMLQGRFALSGFLALLDHQPIRNRFDLDENDVETIRRWIAESGIRWGVDAEERRREGLPATEENTWRMGINRLLLGYAIPEKERRMFAGIVPYGDSEGKEGEMLGRFIGLVETIVSLRKSVPEPKSIESWASFFSLVASELLGSQRGQDEHDDFRVLLERIGRLRDIHKKAGFTEPVEFFVAKSLLETYLRETKRAYGYITGGVTFCSLLPMRSIPARVVCLIGMNNDDYPRRFEPAGFDLMKKNPRKGDPSQKDEDRYLFLEAILSARELFYVSHVGQNSKDNSTIPPSLVVAKLLDYLLEGFVAADGDLRDQLLVSHHLQAFHPAYFAEDTRLVSYCPHNCRAARKPGGLRQTSGVFFNEPLPEDENDLKQISIADLKSFFGNPSRYLLKKRIGLSLDRDDEIPPDSELFSISGLAGYKIGEEILGEVLGGGDLTGLYNIMKASGRLPHGITGSSGYQSISADILRFAGSLKKRLGGEKERYLDVDLSIGGFRIFGRIHDLYSSGIQRYRFVRRLRAKDHIGIWIDLLLLSIAPDWHPAAESFIAGRDERWRYARPDNAAKILVELLDLYSRGIRRPLFFFPETSLCYAEQLMEGAIEKEALRQAKKEWVGNTYANGEIEDPYFRQCFGSEPDFDDEFKTAAVTFFDPLLLYRNKDK